MTSPSPLPSGPTTWAAVDALLEEHFLSPDPILTSALTTSTAAHLPPHSVSPLQGQLLHLLALISHATSILEVGTLGAYSTILLARALPPTGHLITLESNPHHAAIARLNLEQAALPCPVEVMEGEAAVSLRSLIQQGRVFDFVFIDADKANNSVYYEAALQLTHPGSVIVVDNVVRNGSVLDRVSVSADPSVLGVLEWLARVKGDGRVLGTALQTVAGDGKGYDGFALLRVITPTPKAAIEGQLH